MPTPEMCAEAGLYFSPDPSKPDRVKCGGCFRAIYGWHQNDLPVTYMRTIHWKSNPTCPMAIAVVEAWKASRGSGGRGELRVEVRPPVKTVWERARTPVSGNADDAEARQRAPSFLSSATQRNPPERRKSSQPPRPTASLEDDDKLAKLSTPLVGGTSRASPLTIGGGASADRKLSTGSGSVVTPLALASLSLPLASSASGLQTPKGPPPVSIATPSMRKPGVQSMATSRSGGSYNASLARVSSASKPEAAVPVQLSTRPSAASSASDDKARADRAATLHGFEFTRPRYSSFVESGESSDDPGQNVRTLASPQSSRDLQHA
eukprot:TRINITY_DN9822_c0_g1_i1.p1 TRINITY_DN9822_c0_g1~~TRINITY_DN9822_c0_g1_i1.p1  ORF type:complete len:321 (+),score=83.99 TRINITY_DN9822_c0_g1_i1:542-1504(+)